MEQGLPQLSKEELVTMGGWEVYREAVQLAALGAIQSHQWEYPWLSGLIRLGGREFRPRISLKSVKFVESKCACSLGRQGCVCAHTVALCLTACGQGKALEDVAKKSSPAPVARSSPSIQTTATKVAPQSNTSLQIDGSPNFLAITPLPKSDSRSAELLELVKNEGFIVEPSNGKWWLRDRHKTLSFLARYREHLESRFAAKWSQNFLDRTKGLLTATVKSAIADEKDGLSVSLEITAEGVDSAQIATAVAAGRHYAESNGNVVLLPPQKMQAVAEAQRKLLGLHGKPPSAVVRQRVSRAAMAELKELLEPVSDTWQAPPQWEKRAAAFRQVAALTPAPLPDALANQLRIYQLIGVAWLWHLYQEGLAGILADEMGLGKTLQALCVLSCIRKVSDGPMLVVCPASLVENWRREACRFIPSLNVYTHHGSKRLELASAIMQFDLVITSYGTLVRDEEVLRSIDWAAVVADEAQQVKNRTTQQARALRALRAKGRFVLTGTPVENSLDDLRSLFEFLLPGWLTKIPSSVASTDRAWYDERHRSQAAPYILRRTKIQVAPELPAKLLQTLYCEPTEKQTSLYKRIQEQSERHLMELSAKGASDGVLRNAALTELLRLRQVCAEPRLLENSLEEKDSSKLAALEELLDEAIPAGSRLLVFSQFTSVLAHLRSFLESRELPYCYLDGSTQNRQAECDRFNNSPSIPVFLISLKAGGTGLNLTGADTVVHYDPWWNPAAEAQATDRAHRIGQTRTVTSIKLILSGTIEEKVLSLQAEKAALLDALFEGSATAAARLSLSELQQLLK